MNTILIGQVDILTREMAELRSLSDQRESVLTGQIDKLTSKFDLLVKSIQSNHNSGINQNETASFTNKSNIQLKPKKKVGFKDKNSYADPDYFCFNCGLHKCSNKHKCSGDDTKFCVICQAYGHVASSRKYHKPADISKNDRSFNPFFTGDEVLIKSRSQYNDKYYGPFIIETVYSEGQSYKVRNLEDDSQVFVRRVEELKPYNRREVFSEESKPEEYKSKTEPESLASDDEWLIMYPNSGNGWPKSTARNTLPVSGVLGSSTASIAPLVSPVSVSPSTPALSKQVTKPPDLPKVQLFSIENFIRQRRLRFNYPKSNQLVRL